MPVTTVSSFLPGTFYRRSGPDQPVFKEVGDTVALGDTLGLVEVMKTFSAVTAEVAGTILTFHVESDDAVTPGQPLVDIES